MAFSQNKLASVNGLTKHASKKILEFIFKEFFYKIEKNPLTVQFDVYLFQTLNEVEINQELVKSFRSFPYWKNSMNVIVVNLSREEVPILPNKFHLRGRHIVNEEFYSIKGLRLYHVKKLCEYYFGSYFFTAVLNREKGRYEIRIFKQVGKIPIDKELVKDFSEHWGSKFYLQEIDANFRDS